MATEAFRTVSVFERGKGGCLLYMQLACLTPYSEAKSYSSLVEVGACLLFTSVDRFKYCSVERYVCRSLCALSRYD